jgi:deoxyribose-phosphate aldolase
MDDLHAYIDHTFLQPVAKIETIIALCAEAKQYQFASVCVHPYFLPIVTRELYLTRIGIGTVVGFPLGANVRETKLFETQQVVEAGASEIDMVINISALKAGAFGYVQEEVYEVKKIARAQIVKVILETYYLTDEEKVQACELIMEAGADFVKTSTGFAPKGATTADVVLMRKTVGAALGVKASGGIRDRDTAIAMIRAGATRIGTSSGVQLVT